MAGVPLIVAIVFHSLDRCDKLCYLIKTTLTRKDTSHAVKILPVSSKNTKRSPTQATGLTLTAREHFEGATIFILELSIKLDVRWLFDHYHTSRCCFCCRKSCLRHHQDKEG
jgi:hypothetical protein